MNYLLDIFIDCTICNFVRNFIGVLINKSYCRLCKVIGYMKFILKVIRIRQ